jgi:hypothetical protein
VHSQTIYLNEYLAAVPYPRTPEQRLENLFLNLYKKQSFDGEQFTYNYSDEMEVAKNYFKGPKELDFYVKGLEEAGLISIQQLAGQNMIVRFTHRGLHKITELSTEGIIQRIALLQCRLTNH